MRPARRRPWPPKKLSLLRPIALIVLLTSALQSCGWARQRAGMDRVRVSLAQWNHEESQGKWTLDQTTNDQNGTIRVLDTPPAPAVVLRAEDPDAERGGSGRRPRITIGCVPGGLNVSVRWSGQVSASMGEVLIRMTGDGGAVNSYEARRFEDHEGASIYPFVSPDVVTAMLRSNQIIVGMEVPKDGYEDAAFDVRGLNVALTKLLPMCGS